MKGGILAALGVALLLALAVAALTVFTGQQYVERRGLDEYGNIRGEQNTGSFPGTPGYGNGTNLPGSPGYAAPPSQPAIPAEPVACTMDAMQCPDGSFVGRVPPACNFAACPGS